MTQTANMEIVRGILDLVHNLRLEKDFHLKEQWLADRLGVSRSPVRMALKNLKEMGIVRYERNQGYFLVETADALGFETTRVLESAEECLYKKIAAERFANIIGEQVSVSALVRHYDLNRTIVNQVLTRMCEEGLAERAPGRGWIFHPALNDAEAYEESYRYRMIIEPAAILEAGFTPDTALFARIRRQHEDLAGGAVYELAIGELFDADALFHQAIASCCGNRFLAQAIHQQTRLRRLSEYEKYSERERLQRSCEEHLEILDSIESGEHERAANLMAKHIAASKEVRLDFAKVRFLVHRRITRH